jgi:uncharacterized protein (DUF1499 family)
MTERRSRLALFAAILGGLALADALLGPALIHVGLARPMTGFYLFAFGALEAIFGLVLGILALIATRSGRGLGGRGLAWGGTLASFAVLALVLMGASAGRGLPRINDITTNSEDPPVFRAALREAPNAGRDMAYPAEFAPLTREAYPDLEPIPIAAPPGETLARVQRAAESLGWNVTEVRAESFELEANQQTAVFQFVDDVVVRIRQGPGGGSLVDVRSKSRDGRGDVGANAARIRAFREALGG